MDLDIFRHDKKTIDAQKVIYRLWEQRRNPDKVKAICEILCKFADEKKVFRDIEFFLPQLAHLIIHLDIGNRNNALEMVAMVISQNSIHAALQLNFLFNAAMEDYQPEMANGAKNASCNPFHFSRCARLVQDVERAVTYGSREMSNTLEGKIKPNDVKIDMIQRSLVHEKSTHFDGSLNGQLFYKRVERKSSFHTKGWKQRYFVVDQRVLLCYSEPHAVNPTRAISLQNCRVVTSTTSPKYGDTLFEIINESNSTRYLLRAESPQNRMKWVQFLEDEISGAPPKEVEEDEEGKVDSPQGSPGKCSLGGSGKGNFSRRAQPPVDESDMTPVQRKRFAYFKQMRIFVTNLTNICERLRFKEKNVRKFFLQRDLEHLVIPPYVYLPLASSTEEYATILRALPKECHAFSTKARVPALMLFELEIHPAKLDIATFLGVEVEKYSESEVIVPKISLVNNYLSTIQSHSYDEGDAGAGESPTSRPKSTSTASPMQTKFILYNTKNYEFWAPEGKGMERIRSDSHSEQPPSLVASSSSPSASSATLRGDATADTTSSTTSTTSPATPGPLGETFQQKCQRIAETSPYHQLPGYKIHGLIAKSNDDVRQEVFVMQLIQYYKKVFHEADVPVYLHTYQILSTSKTTGLIELITDSSSIDGIKKSADFPGSLRAWYEAKFGAGTDGYRQAIANYVSSMAGYSIICYLLAIKDRHNGNIMLDTQGHVIHIDFGFVFGLAPGKAFSMEKAPWKLTKEMADVMGGRNSSQFQDYRNRCVQAFTVARKHAKQVMMLMEIMQYQSNFPCFRYNAHAIKDFQSRLFLDYPESDVPKIIDRLMNRSYNSTGADLYDSFQVATNGIAK